MYFAKGDKVAKPCAFDKNGRTSRVFSAGWLTLEVAGVAGSGAICAAVLLTSTATIRAAWLH